MFKFIKTLFIKRAPARKRVYTHVGADHYYQETGGNRRAARDKNIT